MARLPIPGSDDNVWGNVLNDFLNVIHNPDGSLKNSVITPEKLGGGTPTSGQLLSYDGTNFDWVAPTAAGDPTVGGDLTGIASNAQIAAGVIIDTDINASAAIAQSKVANLTSDLAAKAATSHTHSGADITSGTIPAARLGSGTADNSTYLRGDGTWATPASSSGVSFADLGYVSPSQSVDNTGASDVSAALQSILNGGGRLYLPPGTYLCQTALLLDSNCHIYVAAGAKLVMDIVTSGSTSSSHIRTRNLTGGTGYYNTIQPSNDVWIYGPGEISQKSSTASAGNLFAIGGDRLVMKDFTTTYWNGGRWIIGVGDNWRLINIRAIGGGSSGSGNGGVRFAGGKRFIGYGLHVESGDDVFQFVPAGSPTDPFFSVSCEDSVYIGCTGSSASSRLMVVGLQDSNGDGTTTLGMNANIKSCGFIGCSGLPGGSGLVIQNISSTGVIQDCFSTDCKVDYSAAGTSGQPGGIFVNGYATTGGIKRLRVRGYTALNSRKKGVDMQRGGEDITFERCYFTRGDLQLSGPVASLSGLRTVLKDCILDGLSTGTTDVVQIVAPATSGGSNPSLVRVINNVVQNIPSNKYGVHSKVGDRALIFGNIFSKLSGSTFARGWAVDSGVTNTRAYGNDYSGLDANMKSSDAGTGTLTGTSAVAGDDATSAGTAITVPGGDFEDSGDETLWTATGAVGTNILTRDTSPAAASGTYYGKLSIGSSGTANLDSQPIAVSSSGSVDAHAKALWITGATPRNARLDVRFFSDAGGTVSVSTATGSGVTTNTSTWTAFSQTGVAVPVGAVTARVRLVTLSVVSGEVIGFDSVDAAV